MLFLETSGMHGLDAFGFESAILLFDPGAEKPLYLSHPERDRAEFVPFGRL
ncbi:hypothetical protein [Haloarchaeobius sp. HRN-SO-5]|uniref:hypothetical protein n=1 Tax=Haloarchaeobius sp. HRN-SO-5 TaxID=3446118 RepID=UPI003EB7DF47